jgi:LysR family glycine cleavage system transcriptional activator
VSFPSRIRSTTNLTLRLPSTLAIRWLLPRLQVINLALPRTELRIYTSADDTPDFTAPDVDAMVVRGSGHWAGMDAIPLFQECLTPMCTSELAASLKSVADLARIKLLHPGHGHGEWRCWLDRVGATQTDISGGLVFDTLELTLTAAAQGHGVAIGDPRMAKDRLEAGALVMPFSEVVQNGLGYFLVFPSQRSAQKKIRALADILIRLAQEDQPIPAR